MVDFAVIDDVILDTRISINNKLHVLAFLDSGRVAKIINYNFIKFVSPDEYTKVGDLHYK